MRCMSYYVLIYILLILQVLKIQYYINIMAIDDLAPDMARSSAARTIPVNPGMDFK